MSEISQDIESQEIVDIQWAMCLTIMLDESVDITGRAQLGSKTGLYVMKTWSSDIV